MAKKRRTKKETLKTQEQKTVKILIITLSLLTLVLSVIFFMIGSNATQNGNILRKEQDLHEELKDIEERLNHDITNASAIKSLEENPQIKDMEKSHDTVFIEN